MFEPARAVRPSRDRRLTGVVVRAISVEHWTDPADLVVSDVPEPALAADQIRVEVHSAGCNFFDLLLVQGKYQVKPAFPFTPGAEFAGEVVECGGDAGDFEVGQRVYGDLGQGAYAERIAVAAAAARPIPPGMSFDEAAALPLTYPTSYAALKLRANLVAGETLLVHAAAGGVGTAAVQIGKAMGARVIGTAGGAQKLEVAREAGADVVIDYRERDFVPAVLDATDGRGADVIYDSVGGETSARSLSCINWNGRLLVIGFASGTIPELRTNRILLKNVAVVGVHWGAYRLHEPTRVGEVYGAIEAMAQRGEIRPIISGRYSLDEVPQALAELASRRSIGKLIVHPRA